MLPDRMIRPKRVMPRRQVRWDGRARDTMAVERGGDKVATMHKALTSPLRPGAGAITVCIDHLTDHDR
jgi:hypothetical protein